jgi:phosphatidylglycerol:prolipoprotein diacylglycerol transferase
VSPVIVLPFPAIDPVALDISGFQIRWYALAYIAGIILSWIYIVRLLKAESLWGANVPVSRTHIDDLVVWITVGIILGGRLGYVFFYNSSYFLAHPMEILALWQGGMAFHGGLIGVIIAVILFARIKSVRLLTLGDLIATAAPIGLFFGRIANFINGELYGRITDVPWAMVFPHGGPNSRHPSQIYESIGEGIILFVFMHIMIYRFGALQRPGMITGLFMIGYGIARSSIEFFRMPDAHIGYLSGGLTMGIVLSVPMIPIGLAFIWLSLKNQRITI